MWSLLLVITIIVIFFGLRGSDTDADDEARRIIDEIDDDESDKLRRE